MENNGYGGTIERWPFPDILEPPLAPNIGQVVFDLDGVLASPVWPARHVIGDPILAGLKLLRYYASRGYSVCILTSRGQQDYDLIWKWIKDNDLPVDKVRCDKPVAAIYIDDRAWRFEPLEKKAQAGEVVFTGGCD